MNGDQQVARKRSSTVLTNTISFTHTRNNNNQSDQEDLKSPFSTTFQRTKTNLTTHSANTTNNHSSFPYLNRNGSSSTIHSITQTLSNVGFTPIQPPGIHTPTDSNYPSPSNSLSSTPINSSPLSPVTSSSKNAFLKAKQFARTKTLKRLNKSATDPNIANASSAMSIMTANSTQSKAPTSFLKMHHHNTHHQNHGVSSSQSNSKLDSGSTLYSFDPSKNSMELEHDGLLKQVLNESNLKNMGFEEKDSAADNLWNLIQTIVIPLFKVENGKENSDSLNLKTPIEDINKLFEVFLNLRIENNYQSMSIISEIQEFLKRGFKILENESSNFIDSYQLDESDNVHLITFYRIALIWEYFFKKQYHYLLGIFLPLQISFESSSKIWTDISTEVKLSIKNLILVSFRDFVILPYFEVQQELNSLSDLDIVTLRKLIQCFGMLKSIQSTSYNQRVVNHLGSVLLQNLKSLRTAPK